MERPIGMAKGKRRQLIILGVFLFLVAGCFAGAFYFTQSNPDNAKVGDCMKSTGENSLTIVKCDDAAAQYRVVGRVDGKSETEATIDACDPYVGQGAVQVYWQGKEGQSGLVLCLAKK